MFPEAINDKIESSAKNEDEYITRLTDREKENTIVYLDSKENVTEYMFSEAVKYTDEKGVIRDKTTKLKSTEKGYTNVDNDVKFMFNSDIKQGISLEYNGMKIISVPESVEKSIKNAEFVNTKISKQQSENRVIYENAFGSGTRIIYTPGFSGYKEDIIIDKYNGRTEYSFIVYTNGLLLKGQYLYDKTGEEIGCFSEIIVFDAEDNMFYGELKTETLEEGKKYRITYILTEEDLKNAAYPIDIDPSVTFNTSGSGSSKTIQDATLYTTNSYGFIGTAESTIVSVGGVHQLYAPGVAARAVFRFPGLYNDIKYNMLANLRITELKLYLYLNSKETSSASIKAYPSATTWTESNSSVASLNPVYSTGTSDTTAVGSVNAYTGINFINVARGWKLGTYEQNKGLMLVCDNGANVLNIHFRSTEHATNRPYVTMTYSVENTFYLNSKYSNRFKNSYGMSASSNMISDAHAFTNIVIGTFGKNLVSGNISNATLIPDACTGGYDVSCASAGCGANCYTNHHRNILRLFDNVYNSTRVANTIYAEWYNIGRTSMCETRGNSHAAHSGIMGGVGWAPDRVNGVSNGGQSNYIYSMPVIGVYNLSTDTGKAAISAKYILAHEMMHVMGITDTYNTQSNHHWNGLSGNLANDQICIMANLNSYYRNYDKYYKDIENGSSPFCSYCENLIASVIDTRYFYSN